MHIKKYFCGQTRKQTSRCVHQGDTAASRQTGFNFSIIEVLPVFASFAFAMSGVFILSEQLKAAQSVAKKYQIENPDPFCRPQDKFVLECDTYTVENWTSYGNFPATATWLNLSSAPAYFRTTKPFNGDIIDIGIFNETITKELQFSSSGKSEMLPFTIEIMAHKDAKCKQTYLLSCQNLVKEIENLTTKRRADNRTMDLYAALALIVMCLLVYVLVIRLIILT